MRHDPLAELQTQENLLMWILAECDPVDVKITLFQIRRVRRQMTAMRREKAMAKVRLLVAVLVVLMLSGFVVTAQDMGQVVPSAEDSQTLALWLMFAGLVLVSIVGVIHVWITTRSMERVTAKVNESIDKVSGFIRSEPVLSKLERGYEGLTGIRKVLADAGMSVADVLSDLSPSEKDSWVKEWTGEIRDGTARVKSQGLAFKAVRREAPPIGDSIDDLAMNSWVPDDEVKG